MSLLKDSSVFLNLPEKNPLNPNDHITMTFRNAISHIVCKNHDRDFQAIRHRHSFKSDFFL